MLSIPFAGSSALADDTATTSTDTTATSTADPAPTDPAPSDPAPATDPAPTDESSAPAEAPATDPSPSAPSKSGTQSLTSPQQNATGDSSLVAGVCDSNNHLGTMDLFQQNTLEDASGDWINGALNQQNSVYAENHFVPQRAVFNLPAGENEFTFTYDMTKNGLYAYDYVDHLHLEGAPAGSTVTWDAPAGTPPVALPSYDNNDGQATVLVHVTIEMAAAGSVTLRWDGHIASELDYGPNMGAGTISGAPYHFSSEQLNCASAGQHDNQLMADAVLAGTLTIVKDAQPDSSTDFHFSILPGGAASTFYLDDDADGTLPNTVTFRVGPGAYTMQEIDMPAGWTLTNLVCVSSGGNTSSTNLGTATGSATVVDDGNTTCTFTNSRESSVVVDKIWRINGVSYGPADPVVSGLGLSAQLKIAGTNQGWGVARTGFLAGDSTSFTEETGSTNPLCTIDSSLVTLDHGAVVSAALPFNTGPLAGGSNPYTITNTVTCVAQVTLVKNVLNGPTPASAWTLSANDGGSGADLSGATGTSGSIKADTTYTLSENNADARYDQIGPWTCTNGVTVTNSTINVAKGVSTTCTVTNATAKLIIIKHVVNNSGGTASASDFTLSFSPGGGNADTSDPGAEAPGTSYWVNPGTEYTVTESGPANYTGSTVCAGQNTNKVTPAANTTVTCTVTNDDNPGTLTLVKVLNNGTSGSTYTLHDFTLTATGPTPVSGLADSASIVSQTVSAGNYSLDESGPDGYIESQWTCSGGTLNGSTVTVPLGGNVTCQITNTAIAPMLTLIKHVVNPDGSGGTAVETNWTLTADGPVDLSGAGGHAAAAVQVGTYNLSESTGPAGYTPSAWTCTGGDQTGDQITLALGDVAICEITNTAQQPGLTLIKNVNHGSTGDTTPATAWILTADGSTVDLSGAGGASGPVPAGTYTLSESGPTTGWTASSWSCTSGLNGNQVTVGLGQSVTCQITNTAVKPKLTLIKHVNNGTTGAGKVPADWTLTATSGQNVVSGPGGASAFTPIGSYALTENGPGGFTASAWTCTKGLSGTNVTLALGDNITCEITNTANPATLTLIKNVNHGTTGDLTPATAWVLLADGSSQDLSGPGGASSVMPIGSYNLSETGPSTYSAGTWSCSKGLTGSTVTLGLGDNITCQITNTAIPSQWNVVKTATVVGKSYADPAHAEPGDTIHYVITATRVGSGVDVRNVNVVDDLSNVTDDADLQTGTVAVSNGTATPQPAATPSATSIAWHIDQIHTSVTLSYDVVVHADAFNATLRNFVTAPGSLNCPVGSTDPNCSTTHLTPSWTLVKTSDEPTVVMPGSTIHYHLTVTNNSDTDVLHAVVLDDLSNVVDDASLNTPLAAGLEATPDANDIPNATGLKWTVPGPIAPGDSVTVDYSVTVDQGAWNAVLDNHATPGEPGGTCTVEADCSTHHVTPPVTTFVVKKVDFETGATLAGAKFVLWLDRGTIGVKDAADQSLGEKTTDANGLAKWGELLPDTYLIEETSPPPGYALPAVTVVPVVIDETNFVPMGEMTPFVFEDPSVGHLAVVAKQQYEKNANGAWVLSDGVIDYGEQVKYIVRLEATGTKLFHNVKATDWVPGYNPTDTHVFGEGSTVKGSLVAGSAKCLGITCNVSVSPGHLVTWAVPGDVRNKKWSVEMIVNFPDAPVPTPFDADGFYNSSLWNVAFLEYDEAIANTQGARATANLAAKVLALPMKHTKLRSNEVVIQATLIEPPPGVVPCTRNCLPNTGSSPYLLQLGALGGLALIAGMALVVRGRRRGEATA